MRRISALGLVAALGLVSLGCSSSGSSSSSSSSSSTSSSAVTTTTAPTTTAATTTAPTTTAATTTLPKPPATAEEAAKGLVARWGADDKAGAKAFATDDVIAQLFKASGKGNTWMFQGCDGVAGGAGCTFSYEGGAAQMHARNNGVVGGTGFTIDSLSFIAD